MDLLKGARFLVFPTELYENFPLTLAEAYACGLPVVGSDTGATKEIVRHDSTGLLFRRGDASDLAAKVTFAWNNPDQMKRMGKQARKEYEDKYTAERNYHLLKAVYNSVLPGGIQASVAAETSDYEQAVPVS